MVSHRAVWKVLGLPLPDALDLLHQCGVTLCVNPDHVRPGTHAENLREAVAARGGQHWARRGEEHPHARLSVGDIVAIRQRRARGELESVLAAAYGVSQPHISLIVLGKRWASVPPLPTEGQ